MSIRTYIINKIADLLERDIRFMESASKSLNGGEIDQNTADIIFGVKRALTIVKRYGFKEKKVLQFPEPLKGNGN